MNSNKLRYCLMVTGICLWLSFPFSLKAQTTSAPSSLSAETLVPDAPVVVAPVTAPVERVTKHKKAETANTIAEVKEHPILNKALLQVGEHVAPKFGMQMEALSESGSLNTMALLGFIFAFLIPLLGLIFSVIGLVQINDGNGTGKGLAIAGIIISALTMVILISLL